jgi:hypothetical protein
MSWKWECSACREGGAYRFSHLVGTVFENTNKPLREWFRVIHFMLTSRKGVSALQIYRVMGFGSYKTAWYMCHRIRAGLRDREFHKLMGIVEVDETFIGGKAKNRHKDKRGGGGGTGGVGSGKTPIAGAVSRKGNVVARVIENVQASTLTGFIHESVSHKVSLLVTDQWVGYKGLAPEFPHEVINLRLGSTWWAQSTPTRSRAFGRSSNAVWSVPFIRSAESTCRCTWPSFSSDTTIARMKIFSARRSADADITSGTGSRIAWVDAAMWFCGITADTRSAKPANASREAKQRRQRHREKPPDKTKSVRQSVCPHPERRHRRKRADRRHRA